MKAIVRWLKLAVILILLLPGAGGGGEMDPNPQYTPVWMQVCAADWLNVRGAPNAGAIRVSYLKRGEVILVHEWANGWGLISARGWWVNGRYLCEVTHD